MNHRMVLGRYADVRETAALTLPDPDSVSRIVDAQTPVKAIEERKRRVEAIVARVRRHFGKRGQEIGARYSRVARALLTGRHWSETGIPRRSFIYARKKVEDFFEALKMRVKLRSGGVER